MGARLYPERGQQKSMSCYILQISYHNKPGEWPVQIAREEMVHVIGRSALKGALRQVQSELSPPGRCGSGDVLKQK